MQRFRRCSELFQTFGASFDTPADPLSGIGNDSVTQQRVEQKEQEFNLKFSSQQGQVVPGLNPKHVKIFQGSGKKRQIERVIPLDVNPQAIEARCSIYRAICGVIRIASVISTRFKTEG